MEINILRISLKLQCQDMIEPSQFLTAKIGPQL